MTTIRDLAERGVKVRFPSRSEAKWARYLDADPGSPEALLADVLASFCAWNAQKEVEDISRRTVAGLNQARALGKKLGAPRALNDDQVDAVRELHRQRKSKRWLARTFGIGRATVDRYL